MLRVGVEGGVLWDRWQRYAEFCDEVIGETDFLDFLDGVNRPELQGLREKELIVDGSGQRFCAGCFVCLKKRTLCEK